MVGTWKSVNLQPTENRLKHLCMGTHIPQTHLPVPGSVMQQNCIIFYFYDATLRSNQNTTDQINIFLSTKPLCNKVRYKSCIKALITVDPWTMQGPLILRYFSVNRKYYSTTRSVAGWIQGCGGTMDKDRQLLVTCRLTPHCSRINCITGIRICALVPTNIFL